LYIALPSIIAIEVEHIEKVLYFLDCEYLIFGDYFFGKNGLLFLFYDLFFIEAGHLG
jgi:hypothetical protein